MNGGCPWLWKSTVINWDGGISPCCALDSKSTDFGNALTGTFAVTWNGEMYRASRRLYRGGFEKGAPQTVCSNCTIYAHHGNAGLAGRT